MKKIFIIIPNLKGGGSERVISNLISCIDKSKFEVTLLLGNKIGKYVKEIPDSIHVIDLKKVRVRHAIMPIVKILRKEKPDIVLSTLGHLNLLIALFRPLLPRVTKFISRESNTISIRNKDENYPWLFDLLFKTVYKRFDLVICQAESMKADLFKNYGLSPNKMVVINNPIDFEKINKKDPELTENHLARDKFNLLIVGRLSYQKRVDHAIKVMRYLSEDYHLTVVGEGELELELKKLIKVSGLSGKVSMIGFNENIYDLYRQADLLLSTSRYEGFPNVVIEANACGIPVIAYNYIGGVNEIIKEGINGNLIKDGDIKEFSKAIIDSKENRRFNSEDIKIMTKNKFDILKIIKKYENVFSTI